MKAVAEKLKANAYTMKAKILIIATVVLIHQIESKTRRKEKGVWSVC